MPMRRWSTQQGIGMDCITVYRSMTKRADALGELNEMQIAEREFQIREWEKYFNAINRNRLTDGRYAIIGSIPYRSVWCPWDMEREPTDEVRFYRDMCRVADDNAVVGTRLCPHPNEMSLAIFKEWLKTQPETTQNAYNTRLSPEFQEMQREYYRRKYGDKAVIETD